MQILKKIISLTLVVQLLLSPLSAWASYYDSSSNSVVSSGKINPESSLPDYKNNQGEFSYSINIDVPDGRNSVTPDFSIKYNSSSTDPQSLYGHGWSDNNIYIEKINKIGVDRLYSDNQEYFYSSFGELEKVSEKKYKTKINNGENYIFEKQDNNSWKVYDKTGTIYFLGSTEKSRISNPKNRENIYRWNISKIQDLNGNNIIYEYEKEDEKNYSYLKNIFYTGFNDEKGDYKVSFV